jgi:hypothetical protein
MDYHLEITKRGNCVNLFIYLFFRGRGNNILIFFFYVLNFPKRYVLDLRQHCHFYLREPICYMMEFYGHRYYLCDY